MRVHVFVSVVVFFAAPVLASAQTAGQVSQTFHFTNAIAPQSMQEVTNAIRTVLALKQVTFQPDAKALTVEAVPSDLALAQWLFTELDAPATPVPAALQVDRNPALAGAGDQLRVYRLAHMQLPQTFQEVINAVRTIPEITRVFPVTGTWSIVVRGTSDQLSMAEWLIPQFDRPSPTQTRAEQKFETPDPRSPEVRVIYVAHATALQSFQEMVNTIRTVPELTKVFPVTAQHAIAVRGPADAIGLAEWLAVQLDQAAAQPVYTTSPVFQFLPSTDLVRIFFLPGSVPAENFVQVAAAVRSATQTTHVFPCTSTRALVFRGSPDQLTKAEQLLKAAPAN